MRLLQGNSAHHLTHKLYTRMLSDATPNPREVGQWAMQKDGTQVMLEFHNVTMQIKDVDMHGMPYGAHHVGIITELFDILLGLNPGFIHKEWEFYDNWRTEDGKYPYTYGDTIGKQWNVVKDKLINSNSETRHAGIFCWDDSCHDRDFVPCTYNFHFQKIDKKLCLTVTMRSQDAIKGWWLDSFLYCHIAKLMALEVGLECGPYTVFQHNIHVYPKDTDLFALRAKQLEDHQSSYVYGAQIDRLTEEDKVKCLVALEYVYSEQSLYSSEYLDNIGSDYWRSLMGLIYAKRTQDETFRKYATYDFHIQWMERILR